jgi:hypothetical protein
MLVNVPRTYGLHISFTVIGAVSALVYLDVRSIHSLRSVFALLGVFVCFPLHSVTKRQVLAHAVCEGHLPVHINHDSIMGPNRFPLRCGTSC